MSNSHKCRHTEIRIQRNTDAECPKKVTNRIQEKLLGVILFFCQETYIEGFCRSSMKFKAFTAIILFFKSNGKRPNESRSVSINPATSYFWDTLCRVRNRVGIKQRHLATWDWWCQNHTNTDTHKYRLTETQIHRNADTQK